MKIKEVLVILAVASAAASPAAIAQAQDQGFYLGGGIAYSRVDIDTGSFDAAARAAGFAASSTSADESDTGWKLFLGYQFNRNFAIEGGYADLGKFSTTTVTTGPAATITGDWRAKAWFADVVGIVPVANNFSLFGKIGLHRWELDARAAALAGGVAISATASDKGTDIKFGLGGRFDLTKNVGLRLEWERYGDIGKSNTTGKGDLDQFSLSLQVRF